MTEKEERELATQRAIAAFAAKGGHVTKCEPGIAKGALLPRYKMTGLQQAVDPVAAAASHLAMREKYRELNPRKP